MSSLFHDLIGDPRDWIAQWSDLVVHVFTSRFDWRSTRLDRKNEIVDEKMIHEYNRT
jgi:hypothetical protein